MLLSPLTLTPANLWLWTVTPALLVGLEPGQTRRQAALLGYAQAFAADLHAGQRLALQVENPAANGHVVLDEPQGQVAGRLEGGIEADGQPVAFGRGQHGDR